MTRGHWPRVLRLSFWNLKRTIILTGSLASLVGTLGGQFYVDPVQKRSTDLDGRIRETASRAEALRNADIQYWSFQAQSSIVFGMAASGTADDTTKDNMLNLHKLSTANRRAAMIPIVGGLALGGEVAYRETAARLDELAKAEQADFTWDNYKAANDFERDLMMRAERRVGALQSESQKLTQAKVESDAEIDRRKLVLVSILTLGSTFLLVANLISSRRDEPDEREAAGETAVQHSA